MQYAPISGQFLSILGDAVVLSDCKDTGTFLVARRRPCFVAPKEKSNLFVDNLVSDVTPGSTFPCETVTATLDLSIPSALGESNTLCLHGCATHQRAATGRGNPLNKGRLYHACRQQRSCSFFKWSEDASNVKISDSKCLPTTDLSCLAQLDAWNGVAQGSPNWLVLRQGRLTASCFGCVTGTSPFSSPREYLRQLIWKTTQSSVPMSYGSCNEHIAFEAFEKFLLGNCTKTYHLEEKGIWINGCNQFLGSSPDGILYVVDQVVDRSETFEIVQCCRYLLEIKTPWKMRSRCDGDPFYPPCTTPDDKNGFIPLHYYDQIVGNCNLIGLRGCFFMVASPSGYQVSYTPNDASARNYWIKRVLPELVSFNSRLWATATNSSTPGFLPDE